MPMGSSMARLASSLGRETWPVSAVIANLDGSVPTVVAEKPVKLGKNIDPIDGHESMRLTIPSRCQKHALYAGCPLQEVRTSGWSLHENDQCITGCVKEPPGRASRLFTLSGKGGIFITRLAGSMVNPPPVTWRAMLNDDDDYLQRVLREPKDKHNGAALSPRRGGKSDFGIHVEDANVKIFTGPWLTEILSTGAILED